MGIIDNSMIKIEIDGIEFKAKRGSKIIEVADEVGIYIPRFCYHKKLSIAANCRMCLVEVEKAPKLFPACATSVADGMKVFTNTEKVIDAQRAVMEFLLINHPLDCPICDQGGECELQDLTVGYGCSVSRFVEKKRYFEDYNFGPLVATDVTRCILCTRCVRFCSELAGTEELGIINRGSNSRIFTFLNRSLSSELSGNIIDLCPVGALTAKPSKFKFRPWELVQHTFVSQHDCVGSNLYVHVFKDKVIRVVPKRNELLNESWISDRDRFSYEGLYSDDRVKYPMVKKKGVWVEVSWFEAYDFSFKKIMEIKQKFGDNQLAALASSNSTLEEFFVLQKFIRMLGSNNIDYRLKQIDFSNQDKFPTFVGFDFDISDIDNMDLVFLIGSNIVKEQPIIGLKLRKIINKGGKVFVLNPIDFNFSMNLSEKYIVNPRCFLNVLSSIISNFILKSNKKINLNGMEKLFENNNSDLYLNLVNALLTAKNKVILLGSYVISSPDYSKIVSLSSLLSKIVESKFGVITDGTNTSGAWFCGFLPHRLPGGFAINDENIGLDAFNIFFKKLKAYVLFGLEVEFDSLYSGIAIQALKEAKFVLSFSSFKSNVLLNISDVILPIASSYENSGTFVNVSGMWQSFLSVVFPDYEIKLGWKAICDMAIFFKFSGFSYQIIEALLNEIKLSVNNNKDILWNVFVVNDLTSFISDNVVIVPNLFHYDNDSLVRRAVSLQNVNIRYKNFLTCNKSTLSKLELKSEYIYLTVNKEKREYVIREDNSISNNVIFAESINIIDYNCLSLPYNVMLFDKI